MSPRTTGFSLTPEQEAVVALGDGSYLVIAPPGSGKTTVLTERVARLLSGERDTFRILALTFTNKAAANMRERLFEAVGRHTQRATVSTFHSFCLDVLRSYGDRIGVPTQPSIYENEEDRLAALERGVSDDGYGVLGRKELRQLLGEICSLKRSLTSIEDAPGTIEFGVPLTVAYGAYERTLRQYDALDFDDLLLFTHRLFVTEPRVAAHYQRMFRYIVMDEAQDTSTAQFEVLRVMCGAEHRNVMLVADADQSIYGFAGATPKNLDQFVRSFGAQKVALTQNFRSARSIVDAANHLIKHNPDRITTGSGMAAATLAAGQVLAFSRADEDAEAATMLATVKHILESGLDVESVYPGETTRVQPEDICILGRSRLALAATLRALEQSGMRYVFSPGREGFFETSTFRMVEAGLRLIANPADILARRTIVRFAPQAVSGEPDIAIPPVELVAALEGAAPVAARPIVSGLVMLARNPANVNDAIQAIAAAGVAPHGTAVDDESIRWSVDAATLMQRWTQFSASAPAAERTLGRFVAHLALVGRSSAEGPGVRVLTIHAAKGLEFRAVLVVGMNEGTFPDFRSVGSEKLLADERRNAYVAITRAERLLMLTRPRARETSAGVFQDPPSRFLAEMGITMTDL